MSRGLSLLRVGLPTLLPTSPGKVRQVHPPHGVDCPSSAGGWVGRISPLGCQPSCQPSPALWTPRVSGPLLAALVRVFQEHLFRSWVHKTASRGLGFPSSRRLQFCNSVQFYKPFQAFFALVVLSPGFRKSSRSEMQLWCGSPSNETRIFDNDDYETRVYPCSRKRQVTVFKDDKPFSRCAPVASGKRGVSRNMHDMHTALRGSTHA